MMSAVAFFVDVLYKVKELSSIPGLSRAYIYILSRITEITLLNTLIHKSNVITPLCKTFQISHFCVTPGPGSWSLKVFICYHFPLPALLRAPWLPCFLWKKAFLSQISCSILSRCTVYDSCGYMFLFNVVFPHLYSMRLFSSVQLISRVWLFAREPQHARPPCPSPTPGVYSNSSPLSPSVMPSSHLIFCCPLLLLPSIFPSISVFSNGSVLHIRWPKYWSFSFSISPSNEHPGLISFRMDWLGLLAVQGSLKSLLQHHSSKASLFWHSVFFIVHLSYPYMTTGKTIALARWTFVGKVMSLLLICYLG